MSTLTEAAAACCACIRVRWVETRHETGEVSGRWVCSSCEREFVPAFQLEQFRWELERERMRLAACGVVALANTPESAAKARDMSLEYHSASLGDVIRAVDAQMQLRAELERARADFARDQAELASLRNQLAARTDERDQCHLRAQTAELEIERLKREAPEAVEQTIRTYAPPREASAEAVTCEDAGATCAQSACPGCAPKTRAVSEATPRFTVEQIRAAWDLTWERMAGESFGVDELVLALLDAEVKR